MSWEALSAIGSFASAAVIAATAVAAVIQIRQLRATNQLAGFIELSREATSTEMVAAEAFIEDELPDRLKDPVYRQELVSGRFDPQHHPELRVGAFWEETGALIRHGVLEKTLFLDFNADICPRHWQLLAEATRLRREREPLIWEQFEYLAQLCEQYKERRHRGEPTTASAKLARGERSCV